MLITLLWYIYIYTMVTRYILIKKYIPHTPRHAPKHKFRKNETTIGRRWPIESFWDAEATEC
jgi:hypothetical protein